LIVLCFLGGSGAWLVEVESLLPYLQNFRESLGDKSFILFSLLYIIALATPFVPGFEIGICLMCLFGDRGVAIAYLGANAALMISFIAGRGICLYKTKLDPERKIKLDQISNYANSPIKYGVLLNTPGNSVFGGGGGISFALGLNKKVSLKTFFLTNIIMTSPLPILIYFGVIGLEKLF
jgi:hypothetical protein